LYERQKQMLRCDMLMVERCSQLTGAGHYGCGVVSESEILCKHFHGVLLVEAESRAHSLRGDSVPPEEVSGRQALLRSCQPIQQHLAARKLRRGSSSALFFGEGSRPFNRDLLVARAEKAWKGVELVPIGLHEGRHTFASILIAAGVNAKALSTYLGHSSIQITLDKYGHLMPGNEDEAVALVDAYLERATVLRQSATVASGFQRSRAES
jgi:hypothetical protein